MGRPWQSASLKRGLFVLVLHAGTGVEGPFCHLVFFFSLSHWGSALFGLLPCGSNHIGCVSVCAQSSVRSSTRACNQ